MISDLANRIVSQKRATVPERYLNEAAGAADAPRAHKSTLVIPKIFSKQSELEYVSIAMLWAKTMHHIYNLYQISYSCMPLFCNELPLKDLLKTHS